jgi:mono/diheme cytochrome c family protein
LRDKPQWRSIAPQIEALINQHGKITFGARPLQSAGGQIGKWLAPNISADPRWGIGDRSVSDLVTFLKTGAQKTEGVAFGPMAEVVHDSLRYVSTADLQAMAVFLKSGPERTPGLADQVASRSDLQHGQKLYLDNCAKCHQDNGRGIPGVIPNLAANAAVTSAQPNDVIDAVLNGLHGTRNHGTMPSFGGALKDQDVADIANYVRTGWRNNGPTNATPALVASLRSPGNADGAKSEAAHPPSTALWSERMGLRICWPIRTRPASLSAPMTPTWATKSTSFSTGSKTIIPASPLRRSSTA